jgi:hypothetical protein
MHREAEEQHSLILPPPNEPPPPPPPADASSVDYNESPESAETNVCNSSAEADCGNVLELPRPLFLQRRRLPAVNREYNANGQLNNNRLRPEYSEEDVDENWQPEDEPKSEYEPNPKRPPADRAPLQRSTGGFIPLNPRGITVRPGERSPLPPTSPVLTTPPGSSAMPYVYRP